MRQLKQAVMSRWELKWWWEVAAAGRAAMLERKVLLPSAWVVKGCDCCGRSSSEAGGGVEGGLSVLGSGVGMRL